MNSLPSDVFVYGTLKPAHRNYHVAQQSGVHEVVGPATLPGFRLFGLSPEFYPGITEGEGTVHGVVLRYGDIQAALPLLDELEMLHDDPPGYRRDVLPVTLQDGSQLNCIVYVYIREYRLKQDGVKDIPTGVWQED